MRDQAGGFKIDQERTRAAGTGGREPPVEKEVQELENKKVLQKGQSLRVRGLREEVQLANRPQRPHQEGAPKKRRRFLRVRPLTDAL